MEEPRSMGGGGVTGSVAGGEDLLDWAELETRRPKTDTDNRVVLEEKSRG